MGKIFQSRCIIINSFSVINLDEALFLIKKNDDVKRFEALMKLKDFKIKLFDEDGQNCVDTSNRVWNVLESEFPRQYYRYNDMNFNFAKLCSYINDTNDEDVFLAYLTVPFEASIRTKPESHEIIVNVIATMTDENVIKCYYEPKYYFNFYVKKSILNKYNLLLS